MKRHKASLRIIAASLLSIVLATAHAARTVFDFENQPIPTETPFSMRQGDLTATFTGPADVDPGAFGISSNFRTSTGFQYRLMQGDFLTIGSAFGASGSTLTIRFDAPLTGFVLDFALDDPADTSTLSFATNGGSASSVAGALSAGFRYPEGTVSFSGAAFTTLTLRSTAIDFQIDNLQTTAVAAVPEPTSLLLLVAGMPLVMVACRRKRGRAG